jgi:ADP-ribosylglycohydrolase
MNKHTATLLGLAYGDAVGFPSLFHRFHVLPAKRHDFLFDTNKRASREHILPLALPFTHRQAEDTLAPAPTDDTEYAVFTAQTLLKLGDGADLDGIVRTWKEELLPRRGEIWTRYSERAALENLSKGLEPPDTGNDNPLHYEDAAIARSVAIGLFRGGDPVAAAALAGEEASISQAEDGIWGAQAVAAAVAGLVDGAPIVDVLDHATTFFPARSWIAGEHRKAERCRSDARTLPDLALLLAQDVINNVYSFGNAAPETVPAALAIVRAAEGDLVTAVATANAIAKSADSLPAIVGALCGAAHGVEQIGPRWMEAVGRCRGCCLPFLRDVDIADVGAALAGAR